MWPADRSAAKTACDSDSRRSNTMALSQPWGGEQAISPTSAERTAKLPSTEPPADTSRSHFASPIAKAAMVLSGPEMTASGDSSNHRRFTWPSAMTYRSSKLPNSRLHACTSNRSINLAGTSTCRFERVSKGRIKLAVPSGARMDGSENSLGGVSVSRPEESPDSSVQACPSRTVRRHSSAPNLVTHV